jgi:hypothetical protein
VDARFDQQVTIEAARSTPMITFGTNPGMVVAVGGSVPERPGDAGLQNRWHTWACSRAKRFAGKPVQVSSSAVAQCAAFRPRGSRERHARTQGRAGRAALVVPGSQQIKREAEASASPGCSPMPAREWRESGCSMCLGMNGDLVDNGQYCVSTSNRNFEGRQGIGARHCSPVPPRRRRGRARARDRSAGIPRLTVDIFFQLRKQYVSMDPITVIRSRTVVVAIDQHRYRPDHPRALPAHDDTRRTRKSLFADWRYDGDGAHERTSS